MLNSSLLEYHLQNAAKNVEKRREQFEHILVSLFILINGPNALKKSYS
jgi:hypothetical protein